jgi:trans-aconitate methyltransferase
MRDEWKDRAFTERWDLADVLRTNPDRLEQLDILVSLLAEECRPGDTILDLGCGSGLVEEAIFRRMPDARVVGIDSSPAMMEKARARLAIHQARFTPVLGDLSDLAALDLPEFRYRCAICVQALHEVPHEVKREVFAFVRERLAAEGTFYVLDRLTYDADGLGAAYRALWGRLNRKASTPEPNDL